MHETTGVILPDILQQFFELLFAVEMISFKSWKPTAEVILLCVVSGSISTSLFVISFKVCLISGRDIRLEWIQIYIKFYGSKLARFVINIFWNIQDYFKRRIFFQSR